MAQQQRTSYCSTTSPQNSLIRLKERVNSRLIAAGISVHESKPGDGKYSAILTPQKK